MQSKYELPVRGEFRFVAENRKSENLASEGQLLYVSGSGLLELPMAA
jgi:hypothetical protein